MTMLKTAKVNFIPSLTEMLLSPSFYMPDNLLLLGGHEFTQLAASLNCLEAWTLLPQYTKRCQEYFNHPRSKSEYLLFAKSLLEQGDPEGAKTLLTKTLQFKWPETHRYCNQKYELRNIKIHFYIPRIMASP